jgi:phosphoesterase RecJ-like protein
MLPHVHIDGDDLGSMVGLAAALDRLGKESFLYSPDEIPEVFRWLPGSERIQNRMPEGAFDAVILMECPSEGRLPPGIRPRELGRVVVNFDHHLGNTMSADVHWVEPERAALGEMAVLLVESLGVPLDREIATALYVALVTDSGNFQYRQVSAQTHRIAARLVEQIGDVSEICRRLFRDRPVAELALTGRVMQTLRTSADGRVAWADLDSEMLRATGAREEDAQNLVADVNRVRGTEVFALFKHMTPGKVRVSLRSTGPAVNQVAALFGGGGHRLAAGLTVDGAGLEEARHQVLEALERQMAQEASDS